MTSALSPLWEGFTLFCGLREGRAYRRGFTRRPGLDWSTFRSSHSLLGACTHTARTHTARAHSAAAAHTYAQLMSALDNLDRFMHTFNPDSYWNLTWCPAGKCYLFLSTHSIVFKKMKTDELAQLFGRWTTFLYNEQKSNSLKTRFKNGNPFGFMRFGSV